MRFEVLVVGSGLSGATAARILAEAGHRVLVIEKRSHIGGNVYDFRDEAGVRVHKYGPHIFHTTSKRVWDFLRQFTTFRLYQHKVLSFVEGRLVPFPINVQTLREVFGIKDLNIYDARELLEKEVKGSKFNDPPRNFRDVVVSQVGERLYELFFKGYTVKQWERDPEELSPEVAKRIPVRFNFDDRYFSDKYQGIPEKGYTEMMNRILDHENISLFLNVDYFEVRDLFKPKLTVYTGRLDRFFDNAYGQLEYRSLRFEYKTLDMEWYQPVATVNYPSDYDFTRITEFKHFLREATSKTTIAFEYPAKEGEPFYVVLTDDNEKKRDLYLKEVKKLEKSGEFLFMGRLAEYKYYNMDQAVLRAIAKVEAWFKGEVIE